jgi:DNA-binding XRE family transcriptional regulator
LARIEAMIKDAIARGARKQVRKATGPLRRDMRRLRQAVRELRVELGALRDVAARWQDSVGGRGWQPSVTEKEAQAARLSPRLIRKARERLGLSQAAVARLVGVSPAAVVQWEQGKAAPGGRNRAAVVGLRRLRRRQVRRILASLPADGSASRPGRKPRGAARRRRPARRAAARG